MRIIYFAALLATFEENMCWTSSVRQVAPPDICVYIYIYIYTDVGAEEHGRRGGPGATPHGRHEAGGVSFLVFVVVVRAKHETGDTHPGSEHI